MNKKLLMFSVLLVLTACRSDKAVKPSDLATEAMERARVAEANIYAPEEYGIASELYDKMNQELAQNDTKSANVTAEQVVDAANKAIQFARQKKSVIKITELKLLLKRAQELNLPSSNPDIYQQANQALINAEGSFQQGDYERAIQYAQQGIDILDPIIGGKQSLALANLNRARELLDRAYQTTELKFSEETLTTASNEIEISAQHYTEQQYDQSIFYSDSAIQKIQLMIDRFPNDAMVSIRVNAGADNIQLQAYDLLQRLKRTIDYIKENGYTNEVEINDSIPAFPLTPSERVTNTNIVLHQAQVIPKAQSMEDVYTDDLESEYPFDSEYSEYMEMEKEVIIVETSSESQFEGVYPNEPIAEQHSVMNTNKLTIEIIEKIYELAQNDYNTGNYLGSADFSREGLRLAELFLAGQTMTNHTVQRRDTLWDISGKYYKRNYWLWPNIWRANKLEIKDPDLIYPKQQFRIPPAPVQ